MNYLKLTPPQIEIVQREDSSFDDEYIPYIAEIRWNDESFGHEFGTENIFTPSIDNLEICINKKWRDLIHLGDDAKNALFEITNEQYNEILSDFKK